MVRPSTEFEQFAYYAQGVGLAVMIWLCLYAHELVRKRLSLRSVLVLVTLLAVAFAVSAVGWRSVIH